MATTKVTFTLDAETLARLRATGGAAGGPEEPARVWTLNPSDFKDLSGLQLYHGSWRGRAGSGRSGGRFVSSSRSLHGATG